MERSILTLNHQQEVNRRLDVMGMHISEFSYSNLYLFREIHNYEIVRTEHGFFVSGTTYDKKRYLMPMSPPSEDCFCELKDILAGGDWDFLFPIPEEWLRCFCSESFEWTFNPNDSDYLFFTEKMNTYPGKKMHKKKNLLNQFLKSNEVVMVPLTEEVLDDAIGILELWQNASTQEFSTSDYYQCREALQKKDKLNLSGVLAYADNRPTGFLLGEPLNNDTFTIHFAKADISFKGVYQFLFSRFSQDYCSSYRYINLEQDMGNAGLRKTKESYRPDKMAHKYRISLK